MPKHYIYPKPLPGGADSRSRLEVHWQRDGAVQIASTRFAGTGRVDATVTYLSAEHLGLPVGTGLVANGEPALAWPGEYVELSREQLNHFIRQLRTARDQAFGRDE